MTLSVCGLRASACAISYGLERVTILGLTFKENVDIRNTRAIDIVRELQSFGLEVQVQEPMADPSAVLHEYGLALRNVCAPADAVVIAVPHDSYRSSGWPLVTRLLKDGRGLVMDLEGMLDPLEKPRGIELWRL